MSPAKVGRAPILYPGSGDNEVTLTMGVICFTKKMVFFPF